MNPWKKALWTSLVLAVVAGGTAVAFGLHWQQAPLAITAPVVVSLEPGEPFARFARRLHERQLVDHPRLLILAARLTGEARQVQAGEYQLEAGDTPATLLAKLVAGEVVTYRAQIVEGWTAMQAVAALAAQPALEPTLQGVSVHTLLEELGLPAGHAEGLFFPDTYQYVRGDTDADLLRRAYRRMEQALESAWQTRAAGLPYDTPYEALIAASLVEKETGLESDRAVISQVFALRLHRGMRLQTDPTIIYGLGSGFDGDLRRADLRRPGPYNTYLNRGLPPTPIALPGGNSIEAAMHPADGEYLYFVSRGDGSSHFSRSLDEHNQAVRRFQLGQRGSGRDG